MLFVGVSCNQWTAKSGPAGVSVQQLVKKDVALKGGARIREEVGTEKNRAICSTEKRCGHGIIRVKRGTQLQTAAVPQKLDPVSG